jgi:tRNA threonylcarbamoyl adenosine modification protein YeaZ
MLEEAFQHAGASLSDIEAIGVGTGPGSFTGLRTGLATAKTLCWRRHLPIVALPTDETIRRAVTLGWPGLAPSVAVVLPAGARDHYVALSGVDPLLVPPTTDLAGLVGDRPVAVLDARVEGPIEALAARLGEVGLPDPVDLGAAALARMPEALLGAMAERLAAGTTEELATLVPRYVALPRGIANVPVEQATTITDTARRDEAWSPTPR